MRRLFLRSPLRLLALSVSFGLVAASACWASFGHHRDPDRVRILSAADAPDPFAPPGQSSRLSVSAAVRKVAGLGHPDGDDEHDCDEDRGRRYHRRTFELAMRWKISQGRTVVRVIEKTVQIDHSLRVVKLPTGNRNLRKFLLVPVEMTWDGKNSRGQQGRAGTYDWEAEALFVRVHEHRGGTRIRILDESDTVRGTVTIASPTQPPVVTITQPAAGVFTRASSVAVTGTVSGQAPLQVTINGAPAAVGTTTFAGSAGLTEGANTITVIATDGAGRTARASITVHRDTAPPHLSIAMPANGSSTTDNTPDFVIDYSDAGAGVDTSTLSWKLDGADLSASYNQGPSRTILTPGAAIADGFHTFTATINDRAGNSANATTTFTITAARPSPPSVDSFPATTNVPVITLTGTKPPNTALLVNGAERVALNASTTWSTTKTLLEGTNDLSIQAKNAAGLLSEPLNVRILLDSVPPAPPLVQTPPTDVANPNVALSGTKPAGTAVIINGVVLVPASAATTWSVQVTLRPGANTFIVESLDAAGNRSITQGAQKVGVARAKPAIFDLAVAPLLVPTGQPVTISYRLGATGAAPGDADLRVRVNVEEGDQLIRTVFNGVQQAGPAGLPYTVTWDGRDEQGQLVSVNTSYRIAISAERATPTTLPPELADANPKESAVTVVGSQQVLSPDAKLRVIFRPDDARLTIAPVNSLTALQTATLVRREIRLVGLPYRIAVDRPFTSPVVGVLNFTRPAGSMIRAYQWNESQRDWLPIARTNWNPRAQSLQFAIPGPGVVALGSTPDAQAPVVTAFTTPAGQSAIRIMDRGSGINTSKTRLRIRGVDQTTRSITRNLNGTREQLVTAPVVPGPTDEILIYLEDWAGNARLHRVKGGRR